MVVADQKKWLRYSQFYFNSFQEICCTIRYLRLFSVMLLSHVINSIHIQLQIQISFLVVCFTGNGSHFSFIYTFFYPLYVFAKSGNAQFVFIKLVTRVFVSKKIPHGYFFLVCMQFTLTFARGIEWGLNFVFSTDDGKLVPWRKKYPSVFNCYVCPASH